MFKEKMKNHNQKIIVITKKNILSKKIKKHKN